CRRPAPPRREPPTPPTRWGARPPRPPGSPLPRDPPPQHCPRGGESDPVQEGRPSASWPYCAVGLISSSRDRHGRTATAMSNPSGPDQENEPGVDSLDETADDTSTPDDRQKLAEASADTQAAPAVVEDHPTEIMAVEPTAVTEVIRDDGSAERRFTAPSGMDSSTTRFIEAAPDPATEVFS